ncbi:hypothetical protein BCR33DRAFT_18171 [Rhizoclosmatium globosum]|uniref:Uncharacterized protein n=1 Tax=Rhizoclosmatium globosum TaxID=329046 RepID=A0A1Y2CQG5_9FUNG|nr:hypothetical protein BCR33DRAFT_18171 [Rhizoclosmatium globosum]|eukprot:ORY49074.1 hypothetical protein BCR33DRAFT_18171 [Rhizoclosmatium globosum]
MSTIEPLPALPSASPAQQKQEKKSTTRPSPPKSQPKPHSNSNDDANRIKFTVETPTPGGAKSNKVKDSLAKARKKAFAHRHYFTLHPACNKLLAKRWEEKTMQLHHRRLRQSKPNIDNRQPKVYPHLEMRLKGVQIEEERLQEIERRNHILLNRISFQMLNPSEVSSLHIHSEEETLALIIDAVDHKRKRDKEKITKENMTILQRIEDKAPNYNRLAWFNERRKNLEYLANISSYPMHYMEDLDEYEEQFPYRGRTPGGTHHPIRAQTHDPKENTDLDTKQTMRPSTEPMRMPKKQENLKKMASANAEEPLVSIPRSHSAGTHKTKQPVRPKPEVTEKVEESGQIPEEIVAGRESLAVDRRPTIPAKDIPEAIDSNIISGSGSKEELQEAEPVEEEVVAEAKETTQSPTLVSKVASKAGSKVNLKDSAPASKKVNDSFSIPASNKASASNLRKEGLASSQKASAAKLASTVPASKQASVQTYETRNNRRNQLVLWYPRLQVLRN